MSRLALVSLNHAFFRPGPTRRDRPVARTRRRRLAMAGAPLALVAGALGAGSAAATPAPAAASAAPEVPALNWGDCGDGFQCATARVPLDYADPAGSTITIALTRLPASDPAHRIGSLFINPGGPGGSGTELVRAAPYLYSDQVRARFDIVGFDPRFVGASRPLATCASDQEYEQLFAALPAFPTTSAQERDTDRAYKAYNRLCAKRSPFLAYGSTANVARDLDLLRQAVGDQKLNFAGYSYGSVIGETYAALFPGNIRSLTIDGVLDAQQWSTGSPGSAGQEPFSSRLGSAAGAYDTFQRFTQLCDQAGPQQCALAGSTDARTKFDQLADALRTTPLVLPDDDGTVDYSALVSATLDELYQPLEWADFSQELEAVYEFVVEAGGLDRAASKAPAAMSGAPTAPTSSATDAAKALITQAKSASNWTTPGGSTRTGEDPSATTDPPEDAGTALGLSVACSDSLNPRSEHTWAATGAQQDQQSPYFGRAWTWSGEGCATWLLPTDGAYLGPYDQTTSAPVLVVGNRHDPATPYSGAQAVAARIPGARLLTVDGYGHTSLAVPSTCAENAFDAYLIDGTLPDPGATCSQNIAPFTTP